MGAVALLTTHKMGRTSVFVVCALIAQVSCLPAADKKAPFPINWSTIQPKYPTFTPWDPEEEVPGDILRSIVNMGPAITERLPGYKKGSKSMAGECGIPGNKDRIVGGEEATPHSFPWMAALFVDESWFCGGTLISDEWVLTAAHCTMDASSMRVMLGAHNVREASEGGRIEVVTTDFFTHPGWSQFNLHNDLALVHLPYALNFTEKIRPVCLPGHLEAGTAWDGEEAVASGWGKPTDSSTSISPTLRWVETDTISNTACWIEFPTAVNKNVICISGAHGKSTCNGDSGGPLYLHNHSSSIDSEIQPYKQIGITSFGSSLGCEIGFHAAFTRTANYLEWIETETNLAIDP